MFYGDRTCSLAIEHVAWNSSGDSRFLISAQIEAEHEYDAVTHDDDDDDGDDEEQIVCESVRGCKTKKTPCG